VAPGGQHGRVPLCGPVAGLGSVSPVGGPHNTSASDAGHAGPRKHWKPAFSVGEVQDLYLLQDLCEL